jgi:phosphohistidine phosphatase SixA
MEVYSVQHGESKSEMEDPERPLTDKGKETVESIARYISPLFTHHILCCTLK